MSEARERFRELLDRAQRGEPLQITRHGEVAAVLVAPRNFARLDRDFASALRDFRASTVSDELLDDELTGLRDPGTGRAVTF